MVCKMRYTTEQDVWLRRCWNTVEYILLEIERITYQYDETVLILCQFSMLLFHLRIRSTPSTINRDDLIQYYFLRFIDGGGGGLSSSSLSNQKQINPFYSFRLVSIRGNGRHSPPIWNGFINFNKIESWFFRIFFSNNIFGCPGCPVRGGVLAIRVRLFHKEEEPVYPVEYDKTKREAYPRVLVDLIKFKVLTERWFLLLCIVFIFGHVVLCPKITFEQEDNVRFAIKTTFVVKEVLKNKRELKIKI